MTKQARCVRCGEWGRLSPDTKYCTDCLALLCAALQCIADTADRARVQAYGFWKDGGANFTEHQCTNHVTNGKRVMIAVSPCQTHLP